MRKNIFDLKVTVAYHVIKKLAVSILQKSKGYDDGNGHTLYREYVVKIKQSQALH